MKKGKKVRLSPGEVSLVTVMRQTLDELDYNASSDYLGVAMVVAVTKGQQQDKHLVIHGDSSIMFSTENNTPLPFSAALTHLTVGAIQRLLPKLEKDAAELQQKLESDADVGEVRTTTLPWDMSPEVRQAIVDKMCSDKEVH